MSQRTRTILKYGLPLLILVGAVFLTLELIARRDEPEREEAEQRVVTVETARVERTSHRLDVRASGTVVPAREVTVQPQVAGEVERVHPQLMSGGLVEKGETLVQIERDDYELRVQQQKTALEQAKAQLDIEKGQQAVAEREWKLFREEAPEASEGLDPSLALRKPQLDSAEAQVEAARAQLESAKLNLRRTRIKAPFDAIVRNESVDVGQVVGTQSPVATLVGTERFRVQLSLPSNKIPYVDIPGVNAEEGSMADIRYDIGEARTVRREGRVVRLLGDLDPQGRMARLLVSIDDPLGLEERPDQRDDVRGIPLLLDAYVQVHLRGNTTTQLVEVPRRAIRDQGQIYVFDDGELAIRSVEIAWHRPQHVLVASGLEDGEEIVVGPLPAPVEGMKLKRASPETEGDRSNDGREGTTDAEAGSSADDPNSPEASDAEARDDGSDDSESRDETSP